MPPKATLGPRKAPDPAAIEAFIGGHVEVQRSLPAPAPAPPPPADAKTGRVVHARKDGRLLRRTTIYMPVALATRVGVFAITQGIDQTDVIREALEAYLASRGA